MLTPMKVEFDDKLDNWHRWGELVEHWIYERLPRPETNAQLLSQMKAHGITDPEVYGNPDDEVKFINYKEDGPLVIMLPSVPMLKRSRASVHANQPYPLPIFYDMVYCGSRRNLTEAEDSFLATCRLGEYTINECC